MEVCAYADVVIAKITSQGCTRREDKDKDGYQVFLYDSIDGEYFFPIPKPLIDGGYTKEHLDAIEFALSSIGLELLPLDQNLLTLN